MYSVVMYIIGCSQQVLVYFIVDLPVLTRSGPKFVDIYPQPIIQRDISTQADMFLAVSSPKQSSPVPTPEVTMSFDDEELM